MTLTDDVRSLLDQIAAELEHDNDRYMLGRELRKFLAAQPEPQGVGLEVVAVIPACPSRVFAVANIRDLAQEVLQHDPSVGINRDEDQAYLLNEVADMLESFTGQVSLCDAKDAQHLLSTERAEAERKMAEKDAEIARLQRAEKNDAIAYRAAIQRQHELREERDSFQRIGIKAAEARDQLRARVAELAELLGKLRAMVCATPENDLDRMPVWISTKHPVIERIDAALNPPQANSQEGEK